MFDTGYYTDEELAEAGFKSIGKNVLIARNSTIIGLSEISIGDNVRIDSYTSIIASDSGYVQLGSFIHIGGYCLLAAGAGIIMNNFSGISHGVKIYSKSDDYSGEYLTNPMIPERYKNILSGRVELEKHVVVGSSSVILPKITIAEGTAVGALSLVTKNLDKWGVYCGIPAIRIKDRSFKLLHLEEDMCKTQSS